MKTYERDVKDDHIYMENIHKITNYFKNYKINTNTFVNFKNNCKFFLTYKLGIGMEQKKPGAASLPKALFDIILRI